MKSYIQGLITGGLFVFTFMVILGHTGLPSSKFRKHWKVHLQF